MSNPPAPGWYEDPARPSHERWWDGSSWGPSRETGTPGAVAVIEPEPAMRGGWGSIIVLALVVLALGIAVFVLLQNRNAKPASLVDACSFAQQVGASYTADVPTLDPYDVSSVQRNGEFYAQHGPTFMTWGEKLNGEKSGAGNAWNNVGVVMTTAGEAFPSYNPDDINSVTQATTILADLNDYLLDVEKACQ